MIGGSQRNGRPVKLAALAALALCAPVVVLAATRITTAVSTSEERHQVFNDAAEVPDELLGAVAWEPDRPGLSRAVEPQTRHDLAEAWLRAWAQLALVADTGDPGGLEVYFASSALTALRASVDQMAGLGVHQLGHDLRVDFYSQDGQVVGLEATRTRLLRAVPSGGPSPSWYDTTERYEAVLVLEDGNWRIHHWVRRAVDGAWSTDPAPPAAGLVPIASRGINYYPRDTPWARFWVDYDPVVVDDDLDRIAALGLGSVRIFVPFAGPDDRPLGRDELAPVVDFLGRARSRRLDVVVTLFDGRTDHRPHRWSADESHLDTIVDALGGHPSIAAWDLKNEPDRDVGIHGLSTDLLYAWLGHMSRHLRSLDAETPITIGWSTASAAAAAPVHGDIVSFHHYGPADRLPAALERLRAVAGDRPVWLTEFGLPTWNTLWPNGHTEREQAAYVADVLRSTSELGVEAAFVWTLWDLASAPPDAGRLPWRTGPQTNLGVLRADGSQKPAALLLAPDAEWSPVSRPGFLSNTVAKPFRMAALALAVLGSLVALHLLRRRHVRAD